MNNKVQKRKRLALRKKKINRFIHFKKEQSKYYMNSDVVDKAKNGDIESLCQVLQHYDEQINDFTNVLCVSDDGDIFCKNDESLKFAMKVALIMAIVNYQN